MPRLRIYGVELRERYARGVIHKRMDLDGADIMKFCSKIGISKSAFYNKMKDTDKFTVRDLRRMKLSKNELNELVYGNEEY